MADKRVYSGVDSIQVVGMILAAICSWQINHSLFWVVVHSLFGWLYIIYLCAGCGGGFPT